jgi:hypothetical protein
MFETLSIGDVINERGFLLMLLDKASASII